MSKFFVPSDKITEDKIIIDTADASHITRVLRMGAGDKITVCDSRGTDYEAEIAEADAERVICKIVSETKNESEPNIRVTLFQGIPKASKMEYIIQKTTELGITEIVPVSLTRCVAKINNRKDEIKKLDRWQKISEAAAKQSGRGIIPEVKPVVSLDEVIDRAKDFDLFFVPYECEEQQTLKETLLSKGDIKTVGFMIGSEGGFDVAETDKLRESGIPTVTLGKRILRTETAGEAVLAMVMYEIGDINKGGQQCEK